MVAGELEQGSSQHYKTIYTYGLTPTVLQNSMRQYKKAHCPVHLGSISSFINTREGPYESKKEDSHLVLQVESCYGISQ